MSSAGIIPSHSHFSYLSELVIVSKQHNFWSQTNPNRLSRSKCRQLKKKLPFSLSTFHIWSQSRCRSGRFMQIKKNTFTLLIVDAFYIFYSIQTLCDTVQLECWKRNVFVAEKISSMHLRLSGQQISLIFAFQLNFGAFGQACVVPICCQQAITKSCSVKNYLVVGWCDVSQSLILIWMIKLI